jgi:Arc/MetJ family transcription regulator
MRTNVVIDDKLMRDTLRATGLKTKREPSGVTQNRPVGVTSKPAS